MSFLFSRNRQKTPQELVRALKDTIMRLDTPLEKRRASEEATRLLSQLKVILQGNTESEPLPDQVQALSDEVINKDLLPLLAENLFRLDFEAKKDVVALFNGLLRYRPPVGHFGQHVSPLYPVVEYLSHDVNERNRRNPPDTLRTLVEHYKYHPEVANNCGTILRESFKHESLARVVLYGEMFWDFFDYVQGGSFDIASDAFSTFRELLTRNKKLVAEFLSERQVDFFLRYNTLLVSSNYVTKRQSIKLLGEILLDRANYNVMLEYVDSPEHLKLTMNLLRDKSKNIQYEAFHVFKVFVANPKKSKAVQDILLKNREKLLVFLPKFHEERKDDEQFIDEKSFLMKQIRDLGQQPHHPQQQYSHSGMVSA
ncbi:Mo25-like protein [Tricharina praecox]|uniref:Mo25-like protein n=1 Tax=Tricharina praecox TaxID=43433 RepID=UPI0022207E83|nr:Mo25-like protein [Tricharina praecox]KAI5848904.1 Mo25-like protein [Tricharina praecox]